MTIINGERIEFGHGCTMGGEFVEHGGPQSKLTEALRQARRKWKLQYRDWKAQNPNVDLEGRKKVVRMCLGKYAYESREAAEALARTLPRRPGHRTHGYECLLCGKFHVGNSRVELRRTA